MHSYLLLTFILIFNWTQRSNNAPTDCGHYCCIFIPVPSIRKISNCKNSQINWRAIWVGTSQSLKSILKHELFVSILLTRDPIFLSFSVSLCKDKLCSSDCRTPTLTSWVEVAGCTPTQTGTRAPWVRWQMVGLNDGLLWWWRRSRDGNAVPNAGYTRTHWRCDWASLVTCWSNCR